MDYPGHPFLELVELARLVSGAIGPLHLSLAIPRCATLEICG